MPIVSWNPSLSVGHPVLDSQHRRLIDNLNLLHEAMMARMGRDVVGDVLEGLVEYAIFHFREEERLMEEAGYPLLAPHVRRHQEFVARVRQFQADAQAGHLTLSLDVAQFLKEWLAQHIQGEDQDYRSALEAA